MWHVMSSHFNLMIVKYLRYRKKAKGEYRLHSPLVFDLYEKVLENKGKFSYEELEERLKTYVCDNQLIFNDEDYFMIVKDIHRNKKNEACWKSLVNDEKVRLSIDCWRFGIIFVMKRIKKEHYILKI